MNEAEMTQTERTLPERLLEKLCSHVVSLSWVDVGVSSEKKDSASTSNGPMAFSVTAFVIAVRGIWFLVTAGHILRDLDKRLAEGRKIISSRLVDGFNVDESLPPIPFVLGDTDQWYVYQDGLDYALLPLRPNYVEQLHRGGIRALDQGHWTELPTQVDRHFLLGFPSQAAQVSVNCSGSHGDVSISMGIPLLPLEPVDEPPAVLRLANERFYARVPITKGVVDGQPITLSDIDGMSGGPLFAVSKVDNDRLRYWVIAIQSGWERKSRVLAACPINPLIQAIHDCIDKYEKTGKQLPTCEQ
jgi:hypothetical protein